MYGVNYAWHHFAGDFGGISPWGQSGVAGDLATHRQKLMDMRAHGVSTIRWWMFPDFRGDGVTFDGNEAPTGLGATTEADIEAALDLAAEADVYLMLTLFSFDNFRPSRDVSGIWTPGITPIALDAGKRGMLVANVVGPVARVVEASANSDRVIAWDVINEPEWAITGASPYGDMDYTPNGELDAVTHGQMETFVADVIAQLRADSSALITVGGAAAKWAQAWTRVDVDFYQLHIYGWVHDYWPYTSSPAQLGLTDKPLVMGELPLGDLAPGESYLDVVTSFYGNGYAGALGWHYDEATTGQLDDVAIFAGMHPCETSY